MSSAKAPRYLIVCFRYIGDLLVTTPLLLSIKEASPDAVVDYLVFSGTEKVLVKNRLIGTVHTIAKGRPGIARLASLFRKYDVAIAAYPSDRTVIAAALAGKVALGLTFGRRNEWWKHLLLDMHYVCYDRMHVVANMQALAHLMAIRPIPRLSMGFDDDDRLFAKSNLPKGRYILIHPYSMKSCKYWSAEKWAELAALLLDKTDCIPVFTETPAAADTEFLNSILANAPQGVFTFSCTLPQFAAALETSAAYIGIDTAATHIAAACEVPTIALYGPSLTRYWAPWPNGCQEFSPFLENRGTQRRGHVTVIQKDWECVPCNRETCRISTRNCIECMEAITAEEVLSEVLRYVNGRG